MGLRSDAMSGVGTKMCFFIDLSQLQHFMPTLLKRIHIFIQSTRKGGTRGPLAIPLMLPKMCFFIDLSQLQHFMPTLLKRIHMFIQSTRKGGTRGPLAIPLMLALTLLAYKIKNTAKFCLRHQQRKIPKMG